MGNTGKASGEAADGLVRHQAIHRSNSCHIIFNVVYPGNQDILYRQNRPAVGQDSAVPQPHALFQLLCPAEQGDLSPGLICEGSGDLIVRIEHQLAVRGLIAEDIPLGIHILLHIFVYIQVVWS